VALALSPETLPEVAANMLGADRTDQVELQQDALKEVGNVLCGNLLPHLAGSDAEFHVGAPELLPDGLAPAEAAPGPPRAAVELCLDAGRASIALFFDADEADLPTGAAGLPAAAEGDRAF